MALSKVVQDLVDQVAKTKELEVLSADLHTTTMNQNSEDTAALAQAAVDLAASAATLAAIVATPVVKPAETPPVVT